MIMSQEIAIVMPPARTAPSIAAMVGLPMRYWVSLSAKYSFSRNFLVSIPGLPLTMSRSSPAQNTFCVLPTMTARTVSSSRAFARAASSASISGMLSALTGARSSMISAILPETE